ncbi:hypothetical protein [Blastomonas sp. UPD001]|uniref:hypothetical protein n=1 Tax=Blastomonas sp. UPD001 TaxID=2217673 RepID=UPI001E566346|nr:hypothetical protein [Blastomonas sp. UPD001]
MLLAIVVALVVGFLSGFALRPMILPPKQADIVASAPSSVEPGKEPRGVQYFEANIDVAHRIVASCREGTVRGGECANAETAIATVGSKERFRRFREDR